VVRAQTAIDSHVRNPMISGVFFVLSGEAVGTGSLPVLGSVLHRSQHDLHAAVRGAWIGEAV